MERLIVERLIDGDMRLVEVENAPTRNSERRTLESRIHLFPFVRVQRDSLMSLAEAVAQKHMRVRVQGTLGRRLPSTAQLMDGILDELGACAAGKLVERVERTVVRPKKLNQKRREDRRRHFDAVQPVPTTARMVVDYETPDPQELLLFFEEEDEAMLALMKYC